MTARMLRLSVLQHKSHATLHLLANSSLYQHHPSFVNQLLNPLLLGHPVVQERARGVDLQVHSTLLVVMQLFTDGKAIEADQMHSLDRL